MPFLLDYNNFCEDLSMITTTKIIDKKKFHPNGLFSEQIFGPLKNYTCQCGTYYGVSGAGGTCNICGVDVVNSDERRRRFAKIVLPLNVVNPIFFDLLVDLGGTQISDALKQLMHKEKVIGYWDDELSEIVVTESSESVPDGVETYYGTEAVYELIKKFSGYIIEQEGGDNWKIITDNIEQLIINQILVLPPDLRPASSRVSKNDQVVDKINRYYMQILTKKEAMEESTVDIHRDKSLLFNYFNQLQKDVNELYKHILEKLSKKEGLIRGNILGKRIDFSGRAVIVPDPTLKMDECSLPYIMFLELFKLKISKVLIQIGKFQLFNDAIDFIDQCIELNSSILLKICEDMAKNEVCLLNRQPSLHRLSMLGYKIKVSLDSVIKIHPLSCQPFNADFDGDQMAVYIPITEETKQEVMDKLLVTKNLSNPSNQSLSTFPSQDIILGIYTLTNHLFPDLQDEEILSDGTKTTKDIAMFNECLPEDYPFIDEPIDSGKLKFILNDITKRYTSEITSEVLDNIKFLGFKYSTLFGSTLSLDDCHIEEAYDMKKVLYSSDNIRQQLERVSSSGTTQFLKDKFAYSYMVESGARGSWDQIRQIVLTRGFISDFDGHIISEPIVSSFISGLTQKEFFNSTYGSRKGLLDVALNTGTSGYLSRKLIFTCANLQIDSDLGDCGTEDLLDIYVDDLKKASMLIGKWMKVDSGEKSFNLQLIEDQNYEDLVGKEIKVRSPIFCKSPKICHKCYGELYKTLDTRFIGIIAAQSLGECNTQLILRTFHTSGVAVIKDGDEHEKIEEMKQQDIVADLSTVSRLLHQFKGANIVKLVSELFTCYNTSKPIFHVHFECVVSQLMWLGNQKWRLLEDRQNKAPEFHSVQSVPSYESWLMGLAFSNPKKHIIKGLLHPGLYKGVMDKILCGEKM